jgi:hypothetical protein
MELTFITLIFCLLGILISGVVIDAMSNYDDHTDEDDNIPTDDVIRRETLKKGKHDTID